jgi:hypothetical protein
LLKLESLRTKDLKTKLSGIDEKIINIGCMPVHRQVDHQGKLLKMSGPLIILMKELQGWNIFFA